MNEHQISYLKYWNLKEFPFEITPDPRFFYYSKEHEEAFTRLKYVIEHKKQLVMITGEYGSGKTLLCNFIISKLPSDKYQFLYIGNPFLPAEEVLHNLVLLLTRGGGIEKLPVKRVEIIYLLSEIIKRNLQIGKHTVILFDEAHLVEDIRVFEEIRVLLNSLDTKTPLSVILLGQTELREKISLLGQFKSRITYHYHIKNLDVDEVENYIKHRLIVAGHPQGDLFCRFAVEEIYSLTSGLPRLINNICDVCLMLGMDKQVDKIHKEIVAEAKEEVLL